MNNGVFYCIGLIALVALVIIVLLGQVRVTRAGIYTQAGFAAGYVCLLGQCSFGWRLYLPILFVAE